MAVFVIGLEVGTQTRGASDNTLHHGRRADMAEGAGCTGDGGVQLGTVRYAVGMQT